MSNHGSITGTGAVCPLGRTAPEFARRLFAGETAIRPMTAEEHDALQATHVARCDGFTPQPEIPAMKARRFDRGSQFALIACAQALAEAGYDVGAAPEQTGIALGTGSAGAGALTEFLRVLLTESPEAAPPFHFPNTVANGLAGFHRVETPRAQCHDHPEGSIGIERADFLFDRSQLGPGPRDARGRGGRVEPGLRDGF